MKYKHKLIYSFIYYGVFILELALIFSAYFITRYYFIFIPIVSVIFVVNVVFYIRQLMTSYELREDGIHKYFRDKETVYQYGDFISVRSTVMYLEIEYRTEKKVRTLYISKLLKNMKNFETEFDSYIMYIKDDILFYRR